MSHIGFRRIRIMNMVLLLKNTLEKMRKSDMVSQECLLDVNMTLFFFVFFFCFLGKTLIMTPSAQIKSFLNDFRRFYYITEHCSNHCLT